MRHYFKVGGEIIARGAVGPGGELGMDHPETENVVEGGEPAFHMTRAGPGWGPPPTGWRGG